MVTASIGVVRDPAGRVHGRRRHGGVRRPRPQTDDIDNYGDYCYLYLRPRERCSATRRSTPVHADRGGEQLATELQGRHNVVSVTLEPGAATLDGKPADRLTGSWCGRTGPGTAGGHLAPGDDRPRRPPRDVGCDAGRVARESDDSPPSSGPSGSVLHGLSAPRQAELGGQEPGPADHGPQRPGVDRVHGAADERSGARAEGVCGAVQALVAPDQVRRTAAQVGVGDGGWTSSRRASRSAPSRTAGPCWS